MPDIALALWREWFLTRGHPWEPECEGWNSHCSFCGAVQISGNINEHEDQCVYVRAGKLLGHTYIKVENVMSLLDAKEKDQGLLIGEESFDVISFDQETNQVEVIVHA